MSAFIKALRSAVRGDVHSDMLHRGIYATDASIYQSMPAAVVCPVDAEDTAAAVTVARAFNIPVLARGGGTSLAGQTVSPGLILDSTQVYVPHPAL